jgi:hypothetical protein
MKIKDNKFFWSILISLKYYKIFVFIFGKEWGTFYGYYFYRPMIIFFLKSQLIFMNINRSREKWFYGYLRSRSLNKIYCYEFSDGIFFSGKINILWFLFRIFKSFSGMLPLFRNVCSSIFFFEYILASKLDKIFDLSIFE